MFVIARYREKIEMQNFQDLIEERFSKEEIAQIEQLTELEARAAYLKSLESTLGEWASKNDEEDYVGITSTLKNI